MTRSKRTDYPGAWHHVMNRGLAQRTAFETRDDVRFFLSLVAEEVRRGRLEIHAFCVLSNHFHLLVRSPKGQLSKAMQSIENQYVRWFNRRHDRDGALFRGRFFSKLIECERYLRILVRYIDLNPVAAGVVTVAAEYPFCTAHYRSRSRQPSWLARDWIRSELRLASGEGFGPEKTYAEVFGELPSPEQSTWIERRIRRADDAEDFTSLFHAATPEIREWMMQRAKIADGTQAGLPIVGPESALETFRRFQPALEELIIESGNRRISSAMLMLPMLLRDACGCSFREVAARMNVSAPTARRRYQIHARTVLESEEYAAMAAALVRSALNDFLPA